MTVDRLLLMLVFVLDPNEPCDICGEQLPVWECKTCDNKRLCQDCDTTWHKHPRRKTHKRERMDIRESNAATQVGSSPSHDIPSASQRASGPDGASQMGMNLRMSSSPGPAGAAAAPSHADIPDIVNNLPSASQSITSSVAAGIPAMVLTGNVPSYHN